MLDVLGRVDLLTCIDLEDVRMALQGVSAEIGNASLQIDRRFDLFLTYADRAGREAAVFGSRGWEHTRWDYSPPSGRRGPDIDYTQPASEER